ncbi:triple gene block protein 1 [Helleborus net necrosis virus]|uniref:Triple gene block protein 1 n=1 Tax=Helleborus net necrosis virus TaxID=592206 RepID=B9UZ24_9VIRU|nr:triple gene block protein 1 [Helleborus net necrosis virus]ACM45980.1 triple gene block protein 1 [Helleborus net necrosis virus]
MDYLVNKLYKNKDFERTTLPLSSPIVINCVPGAGKSTFIKDLIDSDSRFVGLTFGAVPNPDLSSRGIISIKDYQPKSGDLVLIDEYTEGDHSNLNALALFGDPLQSNSKHPKPPAHFVATFSHRFGEKTAKLLRDLDFHVHAEGADQVTLGNLYDLDPIGQIVAVEPEVIALLCKHNCDFLDLKQARGKTFDRVTFYCAESNITPELRADYFVGLTRHRKELLILNPYAALSTT